MSVVSFEDWHDPDKFYQEGHYPTHFSSALKMYPEVRAEIQRLVTKIAPERALEIGPGDRPVTGGINGPVYLDVVSGFLRGVQGKRVQGSICAAPFRDQQFDLSVIADVLTHLRSPDRLKAIEEALRISSRVLFFNPELCPESADRHVPTSSITSALERAKWESERRDFIVPYNGKSFCLALVLGTRPLEVTHVVLR